MGVFTNNYCQEAKKPDFLEDIRFALVSASLRAFNIMSDGETKTINNNGDRAKFIADMAECISKTKDDLHILTLRTGLKVSNLKAVGLLTKHILELLPLDAKKNVVDRRKENAKLAWTIAVSLCKADEIHPNINLGRMRKDFRDRVIQHFFHLMANRSLNGEAAGMIFKALSLMSDDSPHAPVQTRKSKHTRV